MSILNKFNQEIKLNITNHLSKQYLLQIAGEFCLKREIIGIEELSSGNINTTFRVNVKNLKREKSFILQRVNKFVFPSPENIILNWILISEHLARKICIKPFTLVKRRWEIPMIISPKTNSKPWLRQDAQYWRSINFIDCSKNYDLINDSNQAKEVGFSLGVFHDLTSDFPRERLVKPVQTLHDIEKVLLEYDQALASYKPKPLRTTNIINRLSFLQTFIDNKRSDAFVLQEAINRGDLKSKLIHGDPKISNFMFDVNTNEAISLIDFDTIHSGVILYDLGDCLRSCCNPSGEEPDDINNVFFNLDLCEAWLKGYLTSARSCLDEYDMYYLPYSIRLISFELGIRFLTDYLNGNIYFKTLTSYQNIYRAEVQFAIVKSIDENWSDLIKMIRKLRKYYF